jgi:2-methylaconitate cis-trans-isomerase PrpF
MKIKPLIFPAIALVFATTLNGAAIARELDESEQQVNNQLQQAIQTAKGEGYQLSIPRSMGRLTRGAEAPKTVLLSPNREYTFVAVCDQNCNEVNLIVKDMNGKKIATDVTNTAVAVVNFKPPSEDRYQVSVRMEKCSARSCNFGLGIFSKG